MDDRILKYIEHKKLYYEELEEAAKKKNINQWILLFKKEISKTK